MNEIPTHNALLGACQELVDALAGAMRVLAKHNLTGEFLAEMQRLGIRDGIGVRAKSAIAQAETASVDR